MADIDLTKIILKHGAHRTRKKGLCAEEAVAMLAGLGHTDSPACASPVLASLGRRLNDASWSCDAARTAALLPYLLPQIGTAGDGRDRARAFALADVAVREIAPEALERMGRTGYAARLRALAPVVDAASARAAAASYAAAYAACGAAAAYAAYAAAYAAASAEAAYCAAHSADVVDAASVRGPERGPERDAILTRWTRRLFEVALAAGGDHV